jgi:hypothetical protein
MLLLLPLLVQCKQPGYTTRPCYGQRAASRQFAHFSYVISRMLQLLLAAAAVM